MSTSVTVSGTSYLVPQEGDSGWANDVTNLLIQLATPTKVLQVTSSSFPLTQELNLGSSFGLKLPYFKSQTTNPAGTGVVRLGNTEAISWRNNANGADLPLTANASDQLTFNGTSVPLSGAIVNGDISNSAAIAYSKLNLSTSIVNSDISGSAAIAYSKLNIADADLSIAKTSGLQTALDGKMLNVLTTTGDLVYSTSGPTAARLGVGGESQILSVVGGLPAWATFSALTNPMTTQGDLIVGGASGTPGRLAIGSANSILKSDGTASAWTSAIQVDGSGLVGVGSAPVASTALSVAGAGTTVQRISSTAAAGTTELRMGEEATGDRAVNIYMKNANTGGALQLGLIAGSSGNGQLLYTGGGALAIKTINTASMQFYTANTFRGQITGGGFLGMGGTVASYGSVIDARVNTNPAVANAAGTFAIRSWTDIAQAADVGGAVSLGGSITATATGTTAFGQISGRKENATVSDTAGYLSFATTATGGTMAERLRINSSGNVGVGTDAGGVVRLQVKGATAASGAYGLIVEDSAGLDLFVVANNGAIQTGTGGSSPYNLTSASAPNVYVDASGFLYRGTVSSLKYKRDIVDYVDGLQKTNKLRPVLYRSNSPVDGEKQFAGFIAEEIHELGLFEFVQYAPDGTPDALNYQNVTVLLAKAIQELSAKNDEKDLLIASLVARIEALEQKGL